MKYRPDIIRSSSETEHVDGGDMDESKRDRVMSFSEDAFIETLKESSLENFINRSKFQPEIMLFLKIYYGLATFISVLD